MSLLDPNFRYIPAAATDLRKRWPDLEQQNAARRQRRAKTQSKRRKKC